MFRVFYRLTHGDGWKVLGTYRHIQQAFKAPGENSEWEQINGKWTCFRQLATYYIQ